MAIDPREQWEKIQRRLQTTRSGFGGGGGLPGGGAAGRGAFGLIALGLGAVIISNSIFNGRSRSCLTFGTELTGRS